MNTEILKRLDDAISSTLIGNSKDPDCNVGAAICIIKDGKEVYRNEYGEADKENHIPMERNSIFRCYSMTKPVTAVAVMTLVEKGVIALSDPVSNFIPSFKNQTVLTEKGYVPAKREVVIQDLLNMTAGLTYPDASFPAGKEMQNMIDKYYAMSNPEILYLHMTLPYLSVSSHLNFSRARAGDTVFVPTF
mgnify:CR=1 FL=1